jgi:putative PIN family toxin of toxin-antitoxin system
MRVVADVNTIVSGLLWQGTPRLVLDAARSGKIHLLTSAALLAELEEVLTREKFAQPIARVGLTPRNLVFDYAALALMIEPGVIRPVILSDPDDDAVIACAVAADAELIVSGDHHLLSLKNYQGILILTPSELIAQISRMA